MTRKVKVGDKLMVQRNGVGGFIHNTVGDILTVESIVNKSLFTTIGDFHYNITWIGNGLEFVDEEISDDDVCCDMAEFTYHAEHNTSLPPRQYKINDTIATEHTFKVGDRGKTRGGDDYEITAVGRQFLLASISDFSTEGVRRLDGKFLDGGQNSQSDLLPPKRRIQG